MIKKLKAFKVWDKKYSRPYYQYKNKIFSFCGRFL